MSERQLKKKIDQLVKMMMQTGLASDVRNETNHYTDPLFHVSLLPTKHYCFGLQMDNQQSKPLIQCLADEDIITSKTFVQWLKEKETDTSSINSNLNTLNLGSPMSEETFNILQDGVREILIERAFNETSAVITRYYTHFKEAALKNTDENERDLAVQRYEGDFNYINCLLKNTYEITAKINKHQTPSKDEWIDFINKLADLEDEAKSLERAARKCNQTRLISEAIRRFCLIINFIFNFAFLDKINSDRFVMANDLKELSEKHAKASNAIRFFQIRLDLKTIAKHNPPAFK